MENKQEIHGKEKECVFPAVKAQKKEVEVIRYSRLAKKPKGKRICSEMMKTLTNNSGELSKVLTKIYGSEVYDLIIKGEGVFEREREMIMNNKASYFEKVV